MSTSRNLTAECGGSWLKPITQETEPHSLQESESSRGCRVRPCLKRVNKQASNQTNKQKQVKEINWYGLARVVTGMRKGNDETTGPIWGEFPTNVCRSMCLTLVPGFYKMSSVRAFLIKKPKNSFTSKHEVVDFLRKNRCYGCYIPWSNQSLPK